MPAPIILHVGYPKTGTTTLQEHVFPRLPGVRYLGKYIPGYSYEDPAWYGVLERAYRDLICQWDPEPLRQLVNACRETPDTVLLSSEAFVHPIATDPTIVAQRLHSIAPDATILFTIRSQPKILESFYRNHGAFGAFLYLAKTENDSFTLPLSPDDWLSHNLNAPNKNLLGILDFHRVIGSWVELFGDSNVKVLVFEDLVSNCSLFCRDLADIFHVSPEVVEHLLHGRHENPGMTQTEFETVVSTIKAGGRTGDTRTSGAGDRERVPVPVRFSSAALEQVRARFSDGNAALGRWLARELGELGYPVAADTGS